MLIAILVIVALNSLFNILFMATFLWGVFSGSKINPNEEKQSESKKQQSSQRKE